MLKPRPNLATLFFMMLFAICLSACGDSSPDLEPVETYSGSPLRVSIPIDEVRFQWFAVFTDEEDPAERRAATEYRLTQLDGAIELIPGLELTIVDGLEATVDVSGLSVDEFANQFGSLATINTNFRLQANNPDVGWVEITYLVAFYRGGQVIQFDWDEVAEATQYRLTQTHGSHPLFDDYQNSITATATALGELDVPQSSITYPADVLGERFPLSVPLFDWAESRFTLEAFVAGEWQLVGQQDTAGGSYALIRTYTESDPIANALGSQLAFGFDFSLSEDGKTMAVGAIGETSVPLEQRECPEEEIVCDPVNDTFFARNSGAVYVYDLESNEKIQIKSPAVGDEDVFGRSVALSDDGQILAVAAIGEDSAVPGAQTTLDPALDNDDAADSGAVYVYVRAANEWNLEAYIKSPIVDPSVEGELGDLFGWAMALSGDGSTLAISAVNEDGDGSSPASNDQSNSGAVFVYRRTAGVWMQEGYLKASNTESADNFGHALTISADGTYLAVSALGESGVNGDPEGNALPQSGAVYVFARDPATAEWIETSYLKASNAGSGDSFGQSLSFDAAASMLVVGAPGEDNEASGVTGVNSGNSFAEGSFGAAYLFERAGSDITSSWQQKSFYFKASNPFPAAAFGQSVILSSGGDYLAVGAWGDSSNSVGINGSQNATTFPGSGSAYLFERQFDDNESWRQVAFIKAPTQTAYLFFGSAMDMALNGDVVGAAGISLGSAGGISGRPGSVFLY